MMLQRNRSNLEAYVSTHAPRVDSADRRFSDQIRSFEEHGDSNVHIALLGVPQDVGVARNGGREGAKLGPNAIRSQLYKLSLSNGDRELSQKCSIVDYGNVLCENESLETIHQRTTEIVGTLLETASLVIVLGGGHDIAYANGRALAGRVDTMGVINIDAHTDVRPLVVLEGVERGHSGSPFRQLLEHSDVHIPTGAFTEFGIQAFTAAASHVQYVQKKGHHVTMLESVREMGIARSFETAVTASGRATAIYCSFDIDSVQSAFAPGVSAPAADGFRVDEILHCASRIGAEERCRLVDIVEHNPLYDQDHRTAKLIALMIAHIIFKRALLLDLAA